MRKSGGVFVLTVLIIAAWARLYARGVNNVSSGEINLASAVYFVCVLPLWVYFSRSEKNIPYVPFFGIVYFSYFAISIFNNYTLFKIFYADPQTIEKTLLFALIGFISFLVSFYSSRGIIDHIIPHLKVEIDFAKAERFAKYLFFLGYALLIVVSKYRIPFVTGGVQYFVYQLPIMATAMLFLLQLRGKLKFNMKILLWFVFIPVRFLHSISGGGFGLLVFESAIYFFIYFYCRQRIPWVFFIIVSLLFFLIWGARDDFRELTWFDGPYAKSSTIDKSLLYVRLVYDRAWGEKKVTSSVAFESFLLRSNQLLTFVKTVELTPQYIPYWGGRTYSTLFTSFIPRSIYADKPLKRVGQDFGHRYMFLEPDDYSTSYNLPMLVEMYINFGFWGVVIGMFLYGIIMRILYALVNHPQCGEGGFIIGAMISHTLLNIESDFSLVFGNVLQYLLLFYFILKRMRTRTITPEGNV